jgi:hypothetical protein
MKDKLKALFDSKATWATFGVLAGSLLGEKAAAIVQGLGVLVMAAI